MKKILIITAAAVLAVACTKDSITTLGTEGIGLTVGGFPEYTGTKAIGTENAGKTAWAEADILYLILQTPGDSLAGLYRLTCTGSGWNRAERFEGGSYTAVTSISCPTSGKCRASVYYAPSYEFTEGAGLTLREDLTPGVDEFFVWSSGGSYDIDNSSTLGISFSRNYSRIRVSSAAGYKVKLSCAGFIPAGYGTSELGGYTLYATADTDANAFFYGSWPQGSDISLMSYDSGGAIAAERQYTDRDASVDGQGYAVYCTSSSGDDDNPEGGESGEDIDDDNAEDVVNESEFTKVISVTYNGSSATVSPTNILPVCVTGAHVVLGESTSSVKNVKIAVSGSTTDGSLKIYNEKKLLLSLTGASITSAKGPAINSQCGKRIYVTLSGTNSLTDASAYTDTPEGEDSKGCFFSEGQLIFSGDGSLTINGNCKHGIASDDYVRVLSGTIKVSKAASDGIKVNDYYRQDSGTVTLSATGDGIQCDNDHIKLIGGKLTVNTSGAKGHGLNATGNITISGGEFNSTVSGNGSKCIKTDADVTVTGGTLTLKTTGSAYYDSEDMETSSPACIRAENNCTISAGTITCTSTGKAGKGINAYNFICGDGATLTVSTAGSSFSYNGDYSYAKAIKGSNTVVINGGKINVTTTGSGAEGIESKGSITVNGGEIYIKSYDDAMNAAGQIIFNGGYTFAYATKNDAIDSNYGKAESIVFKGGVVIAHGSTSPEEGIDADSDSRLSFCGGTVFCSGGKQGGGSGSSSSPSCTQTTILLSGLSLSTGWFTVTDSNSNVVLSCYVPRSISQAYSFVSSPLLTSGTTYKYGVTTSKPSNPTQSWGTWYYQGGTATVSSGSFTATGKYQTSSGGSGGGGHRPW